MMINSFLEKLISAEGRNDDDIFEKAADDTVTTSTTVFVAAPGSKESGKC